MGRLAYCAFNTAVRPRRGRPTCVEASAMARRRKKGVLRPRMPARLKKRKRAKKKQARLRQYPELVGVGLCALGVFLAAVLYADWNGGYVGGWLGHALRVLVGGTAYGIPVAVEAVGILMVGRSALVDVRPFRTGIVVLWVGLLLTLGRERGGEAGRGLEWMFGTLLGHGGATLLGITTAVIGGLLLSGASIGALIRRSGSAVLELGGAARRRLEWPTPEPVPVVPAPPPRPEPAPQASHPPIDAVHAFPDLVGKDEEPEQVPGEPEEETPSLFDVASVAGSEYRLPDRGLLRRSDRAAAPADNAGAQVAEQLVQTLANFGVEATVLGEIAGPRVTRYELQLAPGTKVSKVAALKDDLSYALATTEIRILAPIPGKQAVGVELPNLSPNIVTLGDIYDELPGSASPLSVWLGKDNSRHPVWAHPARLPPPPVAGAAGP